MRGHLKGRIRKDKLFKVGVFIFSALATVPLFLILLTIFKKSVTALNWELFTRLPKPPGEPGGGVLNAIVGTLMLIVIASILSVPPGILVGIFLSEVQNRFTRILRITVNVLNGIPSIVIGIVAYILVVKPVGGFSAFAGGFALAIIMFPIVIKSTEETLNLIPYSIKEAAYALGASYSKTILKVVLPSGFAGIASGILIGISRIAGETAPLLFTAFGNPFLNLNPAKPVDALPLTVFNYAMSPYEEWHRIAWAASFVLVAIILILNIFVKMVGARWKTQF